MVRAVLTYVISRVIVLGLLAVVVIVAVRSGGHGHPAESQPGQGVAHGRIAGTPPPWPPGRVPRLIIANPTPTEGR